MIIVFLLFLLLTVSPAWSANCPSGSLYVDYIGGSDEAAGTSTGTAWQHSPDDANATSVANCTLIAGNRVNFKGGVKYRGQIFIESSGSAGNPITFATGVGWGTGQAIIDGADLLTFNACTGQTSGDYPCNNTNWASMYVATKPAGADSGTPLFEGNTWLFNAQTPSLTYPFFYTDVEQFRALTSGITQTTCTDSSFFTQSDNTYWTGAYIIVHTAGNGISSGKITNFDPTTYTITYTSIGTNPYLASNWDNKYHYSIFNHINLITKAGQFAIDEANSKIYLWPNTAATDISIGTRGYGFHPNSNNYITIDNLIIQGQWGSVYTAGRAITSGSTATTANIISNCTIRNVQNNGASASAHIKSASGGQFSGNTLSYIQGRGFVGVGLSLNVQNNDLKYVTGTGIAYMTVVGGEISGNIISNTRGTHSNGISVYMSSDAITVKNNVVLDYHSIFGPFAFSWQESKNISVYNNIFDGELQGGNMTSDCSYFRFYNNVVTEYTYNPPTASCTEKIFTNNIMAGLNGGASTVHTYNLYTARYWNQDANSTGESDETTLSNIFTDATGHDYTLKVGSPAINSGTSLSSYFTTDILGTSRPQGAAWDIGAYEYPSGDTTPAAFSFTDNTGVARSTVIYSTSVQVTAIDNTTSITSSGTGCSYQVNGAGSWLTTGGDNVALNDNVAMKVTSSPNYSTDTPCVLTLNGNVSDTWNVTTLAAVLDPAVPRFRGSSMSGGWR